MSLAAYEQRRIHTGGTNSRGAIKCIRKSEPNQIKKAAGGIASTDQERNPKSEGGLMAPNQSNQPAMQPTRPGGGEPGRERGETRRYLLLGGHGGAAAAAPAGRVREGGGKERERRQVHVLRNAKWIMDQYSPSMFCDDILEREMAKGGLKWGRRAPPAAAVWGRKRRQLERARLCNLQCKEEREKGQSSGGRGQSCGFGCINKCRRSGRALTPLAAQQRSERGGSAFLVLYLCFFFTHMFTHGPRDQPSQF